VTEAVEPAVAPPVPLADELAPPVPLAEELAAPVALADELTPPAPPAPLADELLAANVELHAATRTSPDVMSARATLLRMTPA